MNETWATCVGVCNVCWLSYSGPFLLAKIFRQVLGVCWLPLPGSRRAATHSVHWVLLALCLWRHIPAVQRQLWTKRLECRRVLTQYLLSGDHEKRWKLSPPVWSHWMYWCTRRAVLRRRMWKRSLTLHCRDTGEWNWNSWHFQFGYYHHLNFTFSPLGQIKQI